MHRGLPNYLIIGAQRAGTTSLYEYLTAHPRFVHARRKEIHYFDHRSTRSVDWYKGELSPTRSWSPRRRFIGEASPYYIFHPAVPHRVAQVVPDVKLVALLREPVSRAFSHYQLSTARGRETLSFEEALDREQERLKGEEEKLLSDPTYRSVPHRAHSYVSRGIYAQQVERWLSCFRPEQLLILSSEEFFKDPRSIVRDVFNFLGAEPIDLGRYEARNTSQYKSELEAATSDRLRDFFRPHNDRLFAILGRDFGWNS